MTIPEPGTERLTIGELLCREELQACVAKLLQAYRPEIVCRALSAAHMELYLQLRISTDPPGTIEYR